MNYVDFLKLMNSNIGKLVFSLLFSFAIYFFIARKKGLSIFSPFVYTIYSSITATAIMLFLFMCGKANSSDFIFYIIAESAFYIAFLVKLPKLGVSKNSQIDVNKSFSRDNVSYVVYFLFVAAFILNKLILYKTTGIPILLDSRNDIYTKGGGTGIFVRLDFILQPILIYYSAYFLFIKNRHVLFSKFVIVVYVITIILSASKSSFLSLLCGFYAVFLLFKEDKPELLQKFNKGIFKLILVAGLFLFLGFAIQYRGNSIIVILGKFLFRLLVQGDAIFLAFPDQLYQDVPTVSFGQVFFSDLLTTFRLAPSSYKVPSIGTILFFLATGFDYNSGSVTPHQLVGLIEFGYMGGIMFSLYSGLLMNIISSNFQQTYSHTENLFLFLLYTNAPLLGYAFFSFNVSITNLCMFVIPILMLYLIVNYSSSNNKNYVLN